MGPQRHATSLPTIKVILHGHAALGALVLAHRPVLLEGLGAVDRRLVDAGRHTNLVGAAVGLEGALGLGAAVACTGVVGAVGLDDVVFDQRGAGPAVDR
jgi:hypothetical protein